MFWHSYLVPPTIKLSLHPFGWRLTYIVGGKRIIRILDHRAFEIPGGRRHAVLMARAVDAQQDLQSVAARGGESRRHVGVGNHLAAGVGERPVEAVEVDLEEVAVLEDPFAVGGGSGNTECRELGFLAIVGRLAVTA